MSDGQTNRQQTYLQSDRHIDIHYMQVDRHRWTDRQTGTQTDSQRDEWKCKETFLQTDINATDTNPHRETDVDKHTYRQRGQTDKQTTKQTYTDRHTHRRQTTRYIYIYIYIYYIYIYKQTERQTDRPIDRQADKQKDRQTE